MIKNKLNKGEEMWGVSGQEDVTAFTRFIKVKHYNCLSNEISEDFHSFLEERFLFNKLNLLIK